MLTKQAATGDEHHNKVSNHSLEQHTSDNSDHVSHPEARLANSKTIEMSPANPKISELFSQLQAYLDNLSSKFNDVKEKHQADFLIAYRNHMSKVKRELQELKSRSEEQEKQMKQNDRVNGMEKQLSWFREESIKLYQKLELKNKENYELKFKIQEIEKERNFLEVQVKALLKKNRLMEVYLYNQQGGEQQESSVEVRQQEHQPLHEPDKTFYTTSNHASTNVKTKIKTRIEEDSQSLFTSAHFTQLQSIIQKYLPKDLDPTGVTLELTSYVTIVESQKDKAQKNLQNRLQTVVKQNTKSNLVRSDLENFFLDCVETVRRQIMKRRPPQQRDPEKMMQGIKEYTQFRTEDKLKVLELLLTHEKLLVYLYQKIFPTHFSTYVQSFTGGGISGNGNMNEYAVDMVSKHFQERSLQMVRDGDVTFPHPQARDMSVDRSSKEARLYSGTYHPYRKDQPRELRSNSLKVADKLIVKKGKLMFKPI